MTERYISKEKFTKVLDRLMGQYRVYGPVFGGAFHNFAVLERAEDADFTFQNTRMSPKGLLHPHSERMFEFSLAKGDPEAGIVKETPKEYPPSLILGIRPCDARAFQLVQVNYVSDTFQDPWWVRRRKNTILVGLACNQPCESCFCTSTGTGPFDGTALDILLVDVGEGYMAGAMNETGAALLGSMETEAVSTEAAERAAALRRNAEGRMGKQFNVEDIKARTVAELFNAPFWDEVQFACTNCGTCTYLCPTCWCFDIQDEVWKDRGDRIRIWDSCMFPLFTLHGSGHNPRALKIQRVRQRFMHKLKYYPEKYGDGIACVGCGRCVKHCPVNLDIRQVARLMSTSCACPV